MAWEYYHLIDMHPPSYKHIEVIHISLLYRTSTVYLFLYIRFKLTLSALNRLPDCGTVMAASDEYNAMSSHTRQNE